MKNYIFVALLAGAMLSAPAAAIVQYTATDLGTLGGTHSQGWAINGLGQVAGESTTADSPWRHAFRFSGGSMQDLGTLGGLVSHAWGINDAGAVVGDSTRGDGTSHAFSWNGAMTDLGTLGGDRSEARDINNLGGYHRQQLAED